MNYFIVIILGYFFGSLLLIAPITYIFGFIMLLLVFFLYIANPMLFLILLLTFRPLLNDFLVSVRVFNIGLGGILGFFLTFLALFSFLTKRQIDLNRYTKLLLSALFSFAFLQALSILYSPDKMEGIKEISRTLSIMGVFALVIIHVDTPQKALSILKGILFSGLISLVVGPFLPTRSGSHSAEGGYRFEGGLSHPNIYAFFVLIIIGCVLFRVTKTGTDDKLNKFDVIFLIGLIVSLIYTRTRSGWLAFFIMMSLATIRFYKKYVLFLALVCVVAAMTPIVQNRVSDMFIVSDSKLIVNEESSLGWRLEQWKRLLEKGMERPFLGHGLNTDKILSQNNLAAHNDYVRIFVTNGIFAVFLYYFPFVYIYLLAQKTLKDGYEGLTVKLSRFFLTFIPAFLIMSISENLFSYVVIHWLFWALVGLYLVSMNWDNEPGKIA